jgi:hypothetical protein
VLVKDERKAVQSLTKAADCDYAPAAPLRQLGARNYEDARALQIFSRRTWRNVL